MGIEEVEAFFRFPHPGSVTQLDSKPGVHAFLDLHPNVFFPGLNCLSRPFFFDTNGYTEGWTD